MSYTIENMGNGGLALQFTTLDGLVVRRYIVRGEAGIGDEIVQNIIGQPIVGGGVFPDLLTPHPNLAGYKVRNIRLLPRTDDETGIVEVIYTSNRRNKRRVRASSVSVKEGWVKYYAAQQASGVGIALGWDKYETEIRRSETSIVVTRFVTGLSLESIQTAIANTIGKLGYFPDFENNPTGLLVRFEGANAQADEVSGDVTVQSFFTHTQEIPGVMAADHDWTDIDIPTLPSLHEYRYVAAQGNVPPRVVVVFPGVWAGFFTTGDLPWL